MKSIGVLAMQGATGLHIEALRRVGLEGVPVRTTADFDAIAGLILPGGESTVQLSMIERSGLTEALTAFCTSGKPVLATCAGLILCAKTVGSPSQKSFGFLDVAVTRNGWGRQIASFEAVGDTLGLPLVFIRAPRLSALGSHVAVLETYRAEPVLVREGNIFGASFHPELAEEGGVHAFVFGRGGRDSASLRQTRTGGTAIPF